MGPIPTAQTALRPGQRVERYTVERVLGAGGQAVVYLVRHGTLDTLHAMKVVENRHPAAAQRLLREGQAQGSLRHSGILPVTDFVAIGTQLGLVMEYVDGPSLQALLAHRRLTLAQVDDLVPQLLEAVAAAHEAGFIHRDLKPANVLLQVEGGALRARIADFGLTKLLDPVEGATPHTTRTGTAMGTPAYMAPEQIRDAARVDARADLWSLGTILYELVTGQVAFAGADVVEIYRRITEIDLVPAAELVPELPARMAAAIDAALQPYDERVADCRALLALWQGSAVVERAWSEDDVAAILELSAPSGGDALTIGSAVPDLPSTHDLAPPRRQVPRTAWLSLVLAGVAVLATGVWWGGRDAPSQPVEVARVETPADADAETARLLAQALDELYDADPNAERHLEEVLARDPEALLPRMLLSEPVPDTFPLDTPEARLVRLVVDARRDQVDLEGWNAFFTRHPDHYMARLQAAALAVGVETTDIDGQLALHRRAVEAAPGRVLGRFYLADALIRNGRLDEGLREVRAALELDPQHEHLMALELRALVGLGDMDAARAAGIVLLRTHPGSLVGREMLAEACLALGDRDGYERQLAVLLAEEVAPGERARVARSQAVSLFGRGQDRRSREMIARCVEAHTAEHAYDSVPDCYGAQLLMDRIATRPDDLEDHAEALRAMLLEPEVSEERQEKGWYEVQHTLALAAAFRGDVSRAEALRDRMLEHPTEDRRHNDDSYVAIVDGALAQARGEISPLYLDLIAGIGHPLSQAWYLGRHYLAVGDARAWPLLEQVAGETTHPRNGYASYQRADALVLLAERDAPTDLDAARARLDAFHRLWPDPDPDHPLVRRARALGLR